MDNSFRFFVLFWWNVEHTEARSLPLDEINKQQQRNHQVIRKFGPTVDP